jgi:hypothetical protein
MRFFTLSSTIGNRQTGMVKRLLVYGLPDNSSDVHRALMRYAQIFGVDSHDGVNIQEGIALDETLMQMVTPEAKEVFKDFVNTDGKHYQDLEYFTQLHYFKSGE